MYPYKPGHVVPEQLPVLLIGCGPDAFIGNAAWHFNLTGSGVFRVVGFAPSRSAVKTAEMAPLFAVGPKPIPIVGNDYVKLAKRLLKKHPNLVAGIAVETPGHAAMMLKLIELGVRYIITDKPFVSDMKECNIVLRAAKKAGTLIYVTFNHRYSEAVFALRELASNNNVVRVDAGFIQDWIINPPACRQADWRLGSGEDPALTDIGSHAGDLVEFVLQSVIAKCFNVIMETRGNHGLKVYDHGSTEIETKSGIPGSVTFSQTTAGNADNIYICVRFENRAVMWKMEWGPDGLFVSEDPNADVNDQTQWKQQLRGHGKLWEKDGELKKSAGLLSKNPPGHTQGWDMLWIHMFLGIAGDILKHEGVDPKTLPAQMRIPVPLASRDGKNSQVFMARCKDAYKLGLTKPAA